MELVPNKPYNLSFESEIIGVDVSKLKGFLRLLIDGIEYGVPAEIEKKTIKVSLPALETFVKRTFESTTTVVAKLEIFGEDFYLNAWEDSFTIKPVVQARVKPVDIQSGGKVVVKGLKTPMNLDEQIEKAGFKDPRVKELIKKKMKK